MRPLVILLVATAACGRGQAPLVQPVAPAPATNLEEDRQEPPTPIEARPLEPETPPPPPATEPSMSPALDPPPWVAAGPLPRKLVPGIYLREHRRAENAPSCPLLVLTEFGAAAGAKPRRANFSGGWAVAYDKKGLPGTSPSGEDCATCGRGVFGIAGTGVGKDGGPVWPKEIRWSDGSHAGYGPPGGGAAGQSVLAYVELSDADCLYNVWSALGEDHLVTLIRGLRRVAL